LREGTGEHGREGGETVTYDELMRSIETAAGERKREILAQAAAETGKIREAASARAAAIREEGMTEAKRRLAQERERALGQVREEGRMELLNRKNRIADRAFEAAGMKVLALRESPGYRAVARHLAEEATGLAGGKDLVLHVDPRDRALFEGIIQELGRNCDLATDRTGAGGLTVTTRDGRILVTNTLESRLSRAREILKGEVFDLLSGG
jgi:V/A-type H+-transporting ATPase subunit E